MLTDKYLRKLDYLRISITDKCNLRCSYCMPSDGVELLSHDEVLRNEEFIHFLKIFIGLGVKKIRFTGGEPLIRKGFIDMVAKTREMFPVLEICLTTNGVFLDDVLEELRRLRVRKLNISLDTTSRENYEKITGRDFFNRVVSNIEKALSLDCFDIKINSVLSNDTKDNLDGLLDFFKDKDVTLRFIERMPFPSQSESQASILFDSLVNVLKSKGELTRNESMDTMVAIMFDLNYRNRNKIKIGVIPPMTHNICSRCNRLRLTCDGFLKTCLHSNIEYDLKTPYRMDMGDDVLKDIILKAVNEKPKKHNLDCPQQDESGCTSITSRRGMYGIGG